MQLTKGGRGCGKSVRLSAARKSSLYISDARFILAIADLERQINRFLKGHHKLAALKNLMEIYDAAFESSMKLRETDRVEAIL